MKRFFRLVVCSVAVSGLLASSAADSLLQAQNQGLISSVDARRVDLDVMWTTGIELIPSKARIAGAFLFVSSRDSVTTFEMTYSGKRTVVSEFDYGPNGKMFGVEAAEKWMQVSAEIVKDTLKVEPKIEKIVTPKSVLYVSTTDGLVQAIDVATGQTIWSTRPGSRSLFTSKPTANEDFVCVATGSSIYCIDAKTGKPLWDQKCRDAIGAAPAMSDDFVFVPLVNGFVEAFPLFERTTAKKEKDKDEAKKNENLKTEKQIKYEDAVRFLRVERFGRSSNPIPKHYSIKYFVSSGAAMATPTVTSLTTSWPTDHGHFNVGDNSVENLGEMRFRIKTNAPIMASGVASNNILYFAGMDGFVYAVDERDGKIDWSFSFGEAFSQSPVPIGDAVYAVSDDLGLTKIMKQTGGQDPNWPTRIPNITKIISASKDKLYCHDNVGHMVVVRQDTGARSAAIEVYDQDFQYLNLKSDRIFVGTTTGAIQCLRERNQVHPYFHGDVTEEEVDVKPETPDVPEVKPDTGELNPFGEKKDKGENPFGKKDDSKADEKDKEKTNPFGKKK